MIKSSYHKILFGMVIILSIFLICYPFILSHGQLTSPDSPGLWCGARTLINEYHFASDDNNSLGYQACWTKKTYPLYQLLIAAIGWPLGINNLDKIIILFSIIASSLCIFYSYLIVNKIWKNKNINLLTILFTATALPLGTTNLLVPHNLWGFWGILLTINEIIKYFQNKKKLNLVLGTIFFILTYFLHQLSFFVLLVSLFIFLWWSLKTWSQKIFSLVFLLIGGFIISLAYFKNYNIFTVLSKYRPGEFVKIHPFWDHPVVLGVFLTLFGLMGLVLFWRSRASKKLKILFTSLIIGPFIFTLTPYLGLEVVSDRFLYFLWLPFSLLAGYGWLYLEKYLSHYLKRDLYYFLLGGLILASATNFMVFEYTSFYKYSKPYLSTSEDREAFTWLQTNISTDENLLAIYYQYHHPSIFLSSYLNNDISVYSPTLKYFYNYKQKLNDPKSEESKWCDFIESGNFINDYNFDWIIIWPEDIDNDLLQDIKQNYSLEFENDKITIYQYEK